jgi:uncharacterized RDD family membrane protein YckC
MYQPQYVRADPGRRIGGYLIDMVIIGVLYVAVTWALAYFFAALLLQVVDARAITRAGEQRLDTMVAGIAYLIMPIYFIGSWAWFGRTTGQMAVGIWVVLESKFVLGGVGFGAAVARFFGYLACWLTFGIGFFLGWHDKIGNTEAVVATTSLAVYTPNCPIQMYSSTPTTPSPAIDPAVLIASTQQIPPDDLPDRQRRYCSQCGLGVSFGAQFCNGCGTRLITPATSGTSQICQRCGAQVRRSQTNCAVCGQAV